MQQAKTRFRELPEAGLQALETRLQAVGLDLMVLKALLDEPLARAPRDFSEARRARLATAQDQKAALQVAEAMEGILAKVETAAPAEPPSPEAAAPLSPTLRERMAPYGLYDSTEHPGLHALARTFPGTHLDLERICFASPEALQAFAKNLGNHAHLQSVRLNVLCYLGDINQVLQPMAAFKEMHTLVLRELWLDGQALPALGDIVASCPSLSSLDLSGNRLTMKDLDLLCGTLWAHGRPLFNLDVSGNALGTSRDVPYLESWFQVNPSLLSFSAASCAMGDAQAASIMLAVSDHPSLLHLNLASNGLTDGGARNIAALLKGNRALQSLDLGWNLFTEPGFEWILQAVAQHPGLRVVNLLSMDPLSQTYQFKLNQLLAERQG